MRYKQQAPIWPLMCILSCLFVLSVTAPRSWERIARDHPVVPFEVTEHQLVKSSTGQFIQRVKQHVTPPAGRFGSRFRQCLDVDQAKGRTVKQR